MKTPYTQSIITSRSLNAAPRFNNVVMVNINIKFPRVATPRRLVQSFLINRILERFSRRFFNFANRELYDEAVRNYRNSQTNNYPFNQFEAIQNYEVTYNREPFLSMYFDQYTYRGGAHGETERFGFTFNTQTGQQMNLNQFFRGQGYLREIYREITQQIRRQLAQNPGIYFEGYQQNVIRYFDPKNFYLTRNGFAFFYPLYTLAPYATGIPVFIIPYRTLRPFLRFNL